MSIYVSWLTINACGFPIPENQEISITKCDVCGKTRPWLDFRAENLQQKRKKEKKVSLGVVMGRTSSVEFAK